MIRIDFLKNHSKTIPELADIWIEVLGKIWLPDVTINRLITKFTNHLNDQNLPITFVALDDEVPVGMCSLQENDGIRPELTPWLACLVVDPKYQNQGIGSMLIDKAVIKAKALGFKKLYLFAFDSTIPEYYQSFGWKKIAIDEFESHPVTVMKVLL